MKIAIFQPIKLPFDAEAAERILKVIYYTRFLSLKTVKKSNLQAVVTCPREKLCVRNRKLSTYKLYKTAFQDFVGCTEKTCSGRLGLSSMASNDKSALFFYGSGSNL